MLIHLSNQEVFTWNWVFKWPYFFHNDIWPNPRMRVCHKWHQCQK